MIVDRADPKATKSGRVSLGTFRTAEEAAAAYDEAARRIHGPHARCNFRPVALPGTAPGDITGAHWQSLCDNTL